MRCNRVKCILLVILGVPVSLLGQNRSEDDQAVRKIISDFAATWNAHDMQAFGRLFAENADFVVVTGKFLRGRAEIQSYHSELTNQLYKDSHLVWNPVDVRFLGPDVALAHVSTEISYNQGRDKRTSSALVVLMKEGPRWSIASVQNTLTSGPPAAPSAAPK
jgi:uncharacterized protein (TIGR02246 family)